MQISWIDRFYRLSLSSSKANDNERTKLINQPTIKNLLFLMETNGMMTPFEQFKVANMQARNHTSGIAVTGLVTGIVGTVAGVTAWIFAPLYGNAKANQAREAAQAAKEQASLLAASNQRQLDQLTNLFAAERSERIEGDKTLSISINDTVSGQQSGQLTATQQAELSQAQQLMFGLSTGEYSKNPQRVAIYQDAKACPCPCSGCSD
jgi:hypothetical protein